jgi:hypothetical protein
MTLRRGDVLTISGLLATLTLLAATAPQWARLLPRNAPAADTGPLVRAAKAQAPASPDAGKKINVRLYFEQQERSLLEPEDREIAYATDLSQQIRTVVEELVRGSLAGHLPPLPAETKVLGVFVSARGTAYVDLSKEAATGGAAGSLGERLSVYALVNSVTANFPAIRRVQILIDDRPAETFAGHVDLSRPLPPDMTLVAARAPPLEPPPGETKAPLAPTAASPHPPSA